MLNDEVVNPASGYKIVPSMGAVIEDVIVGDFTLRGVFAPKSFTQMVNSFLDGKSSI